MYGAFFIIERIAHPGKLPPEMVKRKASANNFPRGIVHQIVDFVVAWPPVGLIALPDVLQMAVKIILQYAFDALVCIVLRYRMDFEFCI